MVTLTAANAESASIIIKYVNITDYHGDNDGMVERGEAAFINYSIMASSSITSVTVFFNGTAISTVNNVGAASYMGNATTDKLPEGNYTVRVSVSTSDGKSATYNDIYHVTRDYLGWVRVDHLWGPTQMFHTPILTGNYSTDYYIGAVADLKGTTADGNYITLTGGNAIKAPDIDMTVDGGMLVNRTMECLVYLGEQNGSVPLNYSFKAGTYPFYYLDAKTNNITGKLDASKNYDNMTLGVGMINMTMTPRDPVAYRDYIFHDYGNITTDANGDASLPEMNITNPDFYLVVVFDRSVSHGLGLVSVAPLYVVNYTSDVGLTYVDKNMAPKQELNPGDSLMVNVTMPTAKDQKYLFAGFAMPVSDYDGKIDVNSTGMVSNMNLTIDAFTIHFYGNYNDTVKNASRNLTFAQELVSGWSGSNLSASVGSSVGKSLEMPVKIKDDGMAGQYVLITAVVEPESMKFVSVDQTTFNVVAVPGSSFPWWLLLILLLLLIIVIVLVYWFYSRRQ